MVYKSHSKNKYYHSFYESSGNEAWELREHFIIMVASCKRYWSQTAWLEQGQQHEWMTPFW